MNIAITDDHEIVREGLKKILSRQADMKIVAEAGSIRQLEDELERHDVDLVILDISLPDTSGLDAAKSIKMKYEDVKVLLFSIYPDEKFAGRALSMGVDGYLNKNAGVNEIIDAVRKVGSGRKYVKPELIDEFLKNPKQNGSRHDPHEILSDREFEVLRLLAQGNRISRIAEILSLSVNTVETYKSRIHEKLNLRTTAELIRYAIDNNLVERY